MAKARAVRAQKPPVAAELKQAIETKVAAKVEARSERVTQPGVLPLATGYFTMRGT